MTKQHDLLRSRVEQHKPKNTKSKIDDKMIYEAMGLVSTYLQGRFSQFLNGYEIEFSKSIKLEYMIDLIKTKGVRSDFDFDFNDRTIKPDGGVLFLKKIDGSFKKPIIIAEVKRQGTNKQRLKEGKKRQATGNAIERLGKNLIGIKAMMNHEKITPFICFGWGDDFSTTEKTVLSKVFVLNEFYPINKTYVFKKDGNSNFNYFSPVSMYFREEVWTINEMFTVMKEIAETSLRYYIF